MQRNKQHIATSLKRAASPTITVPDNQDFDDESRHGQSSVLKAPFLSPSAIVRTDRSSSFINLTDAYRGNPYDMRNLSPLRRRSEPPNSRVTPTLEGPQSQAAGHPDYEMEYEEQPLDMSIKGKSVHHASNGSSSSSPPLINFALPSSSVSQPSVGQVNRPSVITCAPSLRVKDATNNANVSERPLDVNWSHPLSTRIMSSDRSSLDHNHSMSPKSNGHSQDTIIAYETAKLNISTSATFENPVDEHFRRSLGGLFSNQLFKSTQSRPSSSLNSVSNSVTLKEPSISSESSDSPAKSSVTSIITEVSTDVDDHFAKALGADWLKLKKNESAAKTTSADAPD